MTIAAPGRPEPAAPADELRRLRVLLVEDSEDDARLLVRALRRGGYAVEPERVDSHAAMLAALERQEWDVVVSDYVVPGFGAPAALELLKERDLDLPFLIVSGAIGEDRAVAAMRAGAHDYLPKDSLARLGPAIARELKEAANRRERRRAEAELRASEERFRTLVDATLEGIVIQDRGEHLLTNPAFARMLGYEPEEIVGLTAWNFLGPESHDLVREKIRQGSEEPYEAVGIRKDGTRIDVEIRGRATTYQGRPVRVVAIRDISDRKRAERALELLVEAGDRLSASLDYEQTLAEVAQLAVPRLADVCLIDMLDETGGIRRVAAAHADPSKHEAVEELRLRYAPLPDGPQPSAVVLRTGRPVLLPEITDGILAGIIPRPEHRELIRRIGARSYLAVPLVARSRTLGAMSLVATRPGRRYGESDLELAEALAQRCAVAVDNARLFREAQDAVRVRDDVLASAAHDLKNPLTAIRAALQLLRRRITREAPAAAERLLDPIDKAETASGRMLGLLDELLDATRLQLGQPLELNPVPVDLAQLAGEVAAAHQLQAQRHRIELEAQAAPQGSWDRVRIERVLSNLVGNAVKYSPQGGRVTVVVRTEQDAAGAWAVAEVRDEGIGIPPADLARVFDRFHRASNVVGRIAGTGVGLASARRIVEQHGGSIGVSSVEGEGSAFTVRLPLDQAG